MVKLIYCLLIFVLGTSCSSYIWEKKMATPRNIASESCTGASPLLNLSLVHGIIQNPHSQPVQVQFELQGDVLVASFEVTAKSLNVKDPLLVGEYPYQFDVVEVFVAVGATKGNYPYYEFEVSPLNQTLQVFLALDDKGKHKGTLGIDVGFTSTAAITPKGWRAQMRIPLKNLLWNGRPDDVVGNAFAVLGKGVERTYWSLNLPPQKKPNFHHAEFFRQLLTCAPAPGDSK
jgi:hypothetical protein